MSAAHQCDGALVGLNEVCWRIFAPRWWQVGRWISWILDRRPKGYVTMTMCGEKVRARVVLSDYRPPNVPVVEAPSVYQTPIRKF